MSQTELITEFYTSVGNDLDTEITAETSLKALNLTSSKYFMIIAEMEELGAEDVTLGMLKKCETFADVAALMLEQLED